MSERASGDEREPDWSAVVEASRRGDEAALEAVLAAWRRSPHRALAELAARLERRARREAILGSVDERVAAWRACVAEGTAASIGRAIAAFPIGLIADAEAQLERLGAIADPRVGDRIAALLADPPYRSPAARGLWARAFAIVAGSPDARAREKVRARREHLARELRPPMDDWVVRDLDAAFSRAAEIVEVGSAPPEVVALTASLAPAHDGAAADLLAAVHAAPDDDELRAVYADRLLQAGDPRGELIQLQLDPAPSRENLRAQKALLDAHGRAWLGELAPVTLKTGVRFARGFLDTCHFKAKSKQQVVALIGHPEWSTVRRFVQESMSYSIGSVVDDLVLHPVMRSLRVLDGEVSRPLFLALTNGPVERRVHTLRFGQLSMSPSMGWSAGVGWTPLPPGGPAFSPEDQSALTACRGLPELRSLDMRGAYNRVPPRFLRWLTGGALAARLERLHIQTDETLLVDWMVAIDPLPLAELDVVGTVSSSTYAVRRDEAGRARRLEVTFDRCNEPHYFWDHVPGERRHVSAFRDFIRVLPSLHGRVSRLELRWKANDAPTREQLDDLEVGVAAYDVGEASWPGRC